MFLDGIYTRSEDYPWSISYQRQAEVHHLQIINIVNTHQICRHINIMGNQRLDYWLQGAETFIELQRCVYGAVNNGKILESKDFPKNYSDNININAHRPRHPAWKFQIQSAACDIWPNWEGTSNNWL